MSTLSIDIGGSGIKGMVLDSAGVPLSERIRLPTPRPATPQAVLRTVVELAAEQPEFARVSVGFPGVVQDGVVFTAPNLDDGWEGVELADRLEQVTGRPSRVANDADLAGYAIIDGEGVEMLVTFGSGVGAALFVDGRLVPNLELGHHPFTQRLTYEQYLSNAVRKKIGNKKWSKRVARAVGQILPIWNPRVLYLGGGNAKKIGAELPENVRICENIAGIYGGIRLWN